MVDNKDEARRAYNAWKNWQGVGDGTSYVMEEGADPEAVMQGMKELLIAEWDVYCDFEETAEPITDANKVDWDLEWRDNTLYIGNINGEVMEKGSDTQAGDAVSTKPLDEGLDDLFPVSLKLLFTEWIETFDVAGVTANMTQEEEYSCMLGFLVAKGIGTTEAIKAIVTFIAEGSEEEIEDNAYRFTFLEIKEG
jgi:hypothetical protein